MKILTSGGRLSDPGRTTHPARNPLVIRPRGRAGRYDAAAGPARRDPSPAPERPEPDRDEDMSQQDEGRHGPEAGPRVLAVDVGGSHVKLLVEGATGPRRFDSGPDLTPERMVAGVLAAGRGWSWDVIALGYPGPVEHGRPVAEPNNLGRGWVGFDFERAFGCRVRVLNDAAMQAIGSYAGGRMLFLGLGTGLGSALVVDGTLVPLELGRLRYKRRTYEDYLGERGLKRLGKKRWRRHVLRAVEELRAATLPDEVVLGGGNADEVGELPPGVRRGDNRNAFPGGFRMWRVEDGAPRRDGSSA
jgi:hypothetical protein